MKFAISTTGNMPWLNTTPLPDKKVKSRKIKVSPVIVNDIFFECSQLIDDEYWRDILVSMSHNKIPKGFIYKDGYLTHKKGSKSQNVEIPESPIDALRLILSFMKTTAGLRSAQDRAREKRIEEQALVEQPELTWAELKKIKRALPDMYISNFIRWIAKSLSLTKPESAQLRTLINLGIIFGHIDDIHIKFDVVIQSIDGLGFDAESRRFYLNLPKMPSMKDKSRYKGMDECLGKKVTPVSFIEMWHVYIASLNTSRAEKVTIEVEEESSSYYN